MVAHEYAHGYAALRQGDPTAYQLGRLTLNPLKHIDPWMTILMPAMLWYASNGGFIFGGAKPVPVNPSNYRNYRRGDIIVSLAGITANLILFALCFSGSIVIGLVGMAVPGTSEALGLLQRMLFWGIWLNLLLAFFNLIPIPPLDGSHVFYHFLPASIGARYRAVSRFGFLILLGLIVFAPRFFFILLLPAIGATRIALDIAAPYALRPFGFF